MVSLKMTWKILPGKMSQNNISPSTGFDIFLAQITTLFDQHALLHKLSKK